VLQITVPSFANITITQVLDTNFTVHQLTPDDLRAGGITVDANNYDVYAITTPAIDQVKLTRKPDQCVEIAIHVTEPLDPTTISTGTRVAVLAFPLAKELAIPSAGSMSGFV
jgi:hypothetical protein